METLASSQRAEGSLELRRSGEPGGDVVLQLAGRLDTLSAGSIWEKAIAALPEPGNDLTLDASELSYCDGAGVTLLLDLECQQGRRGGGFRLQNLRDDFHLLLDMVRGDCAIDEIAEGPRRESIVEQIGSQTAIFWHDLRELLNYVGVMSEALFFAVLRPMRIRWTHVLEIATRAGAFALPVVLLIGFILGWIMAFQASHIMQQYGADTFMAAMIGPAMVRELGPLMTTIVLAARSGSAFAAEIGTMKVNEEVDALSTMGLDPVAYLVTPRVVAAVLVTPLLTAFACVAGIVGGAIVSKSVLEVPLVVYTNQLQDWITVADVIGGMAKAMVFGVLVAAIGCIRGLQTERSAAAVGLSTTRAVVSGIVLIALADGLLAILYRILEI